jgi:hypothetical protein
LLFSAIVAAACLALAAPTIASAYWDFQGNLPTSGGNRHYLKYTNVFCAPFCDDYQAIRMSWTVGSHCMRFIQIKQNGSWYDPLVCGFDPIYCYTFGNYDCNTSIQPTSTGDRFGCYNPEGASTVWVNCRATNPLS